MPIRCPKCHHERQPWDPGPLEECPACGIIYEKYQPPPDEGKNGNDKPAPNQRKGGGHPSRAQAGVPISAAQRAALSTAGIRLPDLGDDEPPIDAPPRTNWFWVLAIPLTLLVMAAAVHFQNPGKLLVWLTGAWTEVTRPDGFHVELPDRPTRVPVPSQVEPETLFQDVALYRCDTYGMDLYFAEIRTRVPAPGMLVTGVSYGRALAASILERDEVKTSARETGFAGDEALLWEGAEVEIDDEPLVVEVAATGKGHTLYVLACVYHAADHLRDNAERIVDSLAFSKSGYGAHPPVPVSSDHGMANTK